MRWIDEEAGIYAMTKLQSQKVVTKYISEINFISSARQGDVIEIGLAFMDVGRTSITFKCSVRNIFSKKEIIAIDKIVFVKVDEKERPVPHNLLVEVILQYAEK